MILCPRTGRKPWTCRCPECVAQRTAVGPDVSPTPNRDVGWAPARAVILSDRPVRIAGGAITRGLYFFSRWRRAPDGDILWGPDGQPQREGGPGDGGLQCCVPEQSRSLLRGAMHVASVKPPTVVQLFRTENSEYFALRTYEGEYTFSRDTLDRALREMHEEKCAHSAAQPEDLFISETYCNTPRHWVERAYPMLVASDELIAGARALMFVPPSESIELRTTDAQEIYVARWRGGVHSFTRPALYGRASEIAKARGDDELAADILRSIGAPVGKADPLPNAPCWVPSYSAGDPRARSEEARRLYVGGPALVFWPTSNSHLVGCARTLIRSRHPNISGVDCPHYVGPLDLYFLPGADRYLIRARDHGMGFFDVVVSLNELLGYAASPKVARGLQEPVQSPTMESPE